MVSTTPESKQSPKFQPPSWDDPPPAYEPQEETEPVECLPPDLPQPSNHLIVQRGNQSLQGLFVVDPRMVVPTFDKLIPGGARPNLWLKTTNGSLNGNAIVLCGHNRPSTSGTTPTVLVAETTNGSANFKVMDCSSHKRAKLDISLSTTCGSANLYLPRSFRGLLVLKTKHGGCRLSSAIQSRLITFSDMDKTKTCFLGDYSDWSPGQEWTGDVARVTTTCGGMRVAYVDEAYGVLKKFSKYSL